MKVLSPSTLPFSKQFVIRNSDDSVITTGLKNAEILIPDGFKISAWRMRLPKQSGSATVDIVKNNGTYPNLVTSITASSAPSITSARSASGTPSGWTNLVAGDIISPNVTSCSLATLILLELDFVPIA